MAGNNFSDKLKESKDKLKESVTFQDLDGFRRKYSLEIFTVISLAVASVSSAWDFFTGPKLTIFFFALCVILAIFFPDQVQKAVRKNYSFLYSQESTTQMILNGVCIVMGVFVPFIIFGAFGLLAGLSFHYFSHQAQMKDERKSIKLARDVSDEQD